MEGGGGREVEGEGGEWMEGGGRAGREGETHNALECKSTVHVYTIDSIMKWPIYTVPVKSFRSLVISNKSQQ